MVKVSFYKSLQPSIDLEQLANHLGSSFGSIKGAQPSQKAFENILCEILCKIDPNAYIFIEAESKRMGKCTVPTAFTRTYATESFRVEITAPI